MASPHFEMRPVQSISPEAWRRVVNPLEAGRIVNRRLEARHGHEPSDLRIITCQLQNPTIETVGLLLDRLAGLEQRPDHSDQLGTIREQLLGPPGKDTDRHS